MMKLFKKKSNYRKTNIYVNTRCIHRNLKGSKRYLKEILKRIPEKIKKVYPKKVEGQILGQLWVQACLPVYTRRGLLWSPTGIGPIVQNDHVLTIHDVSPIDSPGWFTNAYSSWVKAILPTLVRKCNCIITISNFTKSRLIDLFDIPEYKIRVVYNGVGENFYPRSEEKKRKVKKELEIPNKKYFLSVGTISPRKNTKRLLAAWSKAQELLDDEYWLVMVGERGPAHGRVDLDVPNRVLFTGYVMDEHLPPLYSGAVAFLYPSLYEGFGLPPLEAMASGTPPLVGNQTSLPEVVGDAGMLVNPLDVNSIVNGILKIAQNEPLADHLREKSLQRASQFGWDKSARETWSILQEAAR